MRTDNRNTEKADAGKRKKNKIWGVAAVFVLCIGTLAGCGSGRALEEPSGMEPDGGNTKLIKGEEFDPDRKSIVCTTFPQYDWMRNVLGRHEEEYNLTLLLDSGMDLHSYQPTAEDMSRIASCDLFVYVGGESDAWVKDALREAVNEDMQTINMMEVLGTSVKEEAVIEGMQGAEPEEEHGGEETGKAEEPDQGGGTGTEAPENGEEAGQEASVQGGGTGTEASGEGGEPGEEEKEYDEHIWLSLKNAQRITAELGNAMGGMDAEHAQEYKANAESYNKKLAALDEQYADIAGRAWTDTVLFGDRFPFRYLTDDYGWQYYAAFVGCSAETEASFETVAFLAGKVDELGLHYIFVLDGSDQKIATAIINSTKNKSCEMVSVNSMQSVTGKDVEDGITYLSVMEENRKAFEKALTQ